MYIISLCVFPSTLFYRALTKPSSPLSWVTAVAPDSSPPCCLTSLMSIPTHQLVWQQIYSCFFQSLLPASQGLLLLSRGIQSCSLGRSWQGIWNHFTSSVSSSLTLSLSLWTSDVMTSPHSIRRLPFSLPKMYILPVFVLASLSFQCNCHFLREVVLYSTNWTISFSDGFWSTYASCSALLSLFIMRYQAVTKIYLFY